jgi:hypothetical protein
MYSVFSLLCVKRIAIVEKVLNAYFHTLKKDNPSDRYWAASTKVYAYVLGNGPGLMNALVWRMIQCNIIARPPRLWLE